MRLEASLIGTSPCYVTRNCQQNKKKIKQKKQKKYPALSLFPPIGYFQRIIRFSRLDEKKSTAADPCPVLKAAVRGPPVGLGLDLETHRDTRSRSENYSNSRFLNATEEASQANPYLVGEYFTLPRLAWNTGLIFLSVLCTIRSVWRCADTNLRPEQP